MLQPFITFQGQAAEAMDFYAQVFGGSNKESNKGTNKETNKELNKEIMRYGDTNSPVSENMKDKVLYGKMTICGTDVMFSDTDPAFHSPQTFAASCFISLAMGFDDEDTLRDVYQELSKDGVVLMEIGPQFFAKMYAWVQDKFGVTWQLTYGQL